jgi:K+-transporting ATPase ATPase C chain
MKGMKSLSSAVRLTLISVLICGLVFPLVMTGIGEVAMPWQSNGSQVYFDGKSIGSDIIAQNFSAPVFFHPRNDSASGVDPDITITEAMNQIPRIHNSTGIPLSFLNSTLQKYKQYTLFFFGTPYINVLNVNLYLVESYPSIYEPYIQ